jgi:hypothetical protein
LYKIHKYLIHYNFFISLCSIALISYFSILLRQPVPGYVYVLTFFATLFAYNLFRNYQSVREYLSRFASFSSELVTFSLLLCIICYALLPRALQLFYTAPALLAMTYKFPLFGRNNLRSSFFLKVFIIAVVWIMVGAGAVFYDRFSLVRVEHLLPLATAQFLFFIAITLPFDVFDVEKDQFKTFPTVFGVKITMAISKLCLLGYTVMNILCSASWQGKAGHVLVALVTLFVLLSYKKLEHKITRYYFVDGLILLQTFIIYFFH